MKIFCISQVEPWPAWLRGWSRSKVEEDRLRKQGCSVGLPTSAMANNLLCTPNATKKRTKGEADPTSRCRDTQGGPGLSWEKRMFLKVSKALLNGKRSQITLSDIDPPWKSNYNEMEQVESVRSHKPQSIPKWENKCHMLQQLFIVPKNGDS